LLLVFVELGFLVVVVGVIIVLVDPIM
jgi:hypothetical protein